MIHYFYERLRQIASRLRFKRQPDPENEEGKKGIKDRAIAICCLFPGCY